MDSEHDVSVASAASVYENFPFNKFDCTLVYIGRDGKWYEGNYTQEDLNKNKLVDHQELFLRFDRKNTGFYRKDEESNLHIDAAFLMLHGKTGEGGHVQGLLDVAHIPFTGCNLLSSALCMDKAYTHIVCESAGIKMAKYQLIAKKNDLDISMIEYPCIVKPSREGSSFGVSYVQNSIDLGPALEAAFQFDDRVLIEEYVRGVEVGISILDTKEGRILSEVDQVNVSGDFFDFKEKYHPHNTETLDQSTFPTEVLDKIKVIASDIFDVLYCEQFARLDFFVTADHQIYFNEVNTIPGFTSNSRYPQMLNRVGVPFDDLISKLVEDIL